MNEWHYWPSKDVRIPWWTMAHIHVSSKGGTSGADNRLYKSMRFLIIRQLIGTVEKVLMKRVFRIALLAFISATTLSGCLVEKKDLVQIARTTNFLRLYQAGDIITYNVEELRLSDLTTRNGILTIEWRSHTSLLRPGPVTPLIPVLEQVITLSFDGGATETGTVRYISQDATTREVTLHAIQAPGANPYYWLSATDLINTPITTESFSIFTSPMGVGIDPAPVNFNLMEDCDASSSCNYHFGRYSDDMNIVGDSTSIITSLGEFTDPFQISFNGTTIPDNGFPVIDVRNICGTNTTTHAGTMYVMPEIGIIRMTNTCDDTGGERVRHTIKIRSTNIPLP